MYPPSKLVSNFICNYPLFYSLQSHSRESVHIYPKSPTGKGSPQSSLPRCHFALLLWRLCLAHPAHHLPLPYSLQSPFFSEPRPCSSTSFLHGPPVSRYDQPSVSTYSTV